MLPKSRLIYSIEIVIVNTNCIRGNMENIQINGTSFWSIKPIVASGFETINYTIRRSCKGWVGVDVNS